MSPRLASLFFFASWALLLCPRVVDAVTTFSLFQYAPSGGLFGVNGTDRAMCTPIVPITNAISVYNAWGTGVNGAGTCNLTWTFVASANGPHTLVDSCSPTQTYTVTIVSTGTDAGGNSYAREMLWSTSNSRSYSYYSGCSVRHELAALWTATSDSSTGGWISHFGWSTSYQRSPESYCTWDRITCNSANKIVAIDLSSNRLGNNPSPLFRAKIGATWMYLEKFIVANNAIKLSLDTANLTSMWPQLREFDVSNNQLYGVAPPSFGSAWNLRRLNLAGNAALQTSYAFGRAAWATDATLLTACNLGSLAFWSGWPAWIGKCNYKVPWQCLTPVTSFSDASCVPYVASAPATLGLVVGGTLTTPTILALALTVFACLAVVGCCLACITKAPPAATPATPAPALAKSATGSASITVETSFDSEAAPNLKPIVEPNLKSCAVSIELCELPPTQVPLSQELAAASQPPPGKKPPPPPPRFQRSKTLPEQASVGSEIAAVSDGNSSKPNAAAVPSPIAAPALAPALALVSPDALPAPASAVSFELCDIPPPPPPPQETAVATQPPPRKKQPPPPPRFQRSMSLPEQAVVGEAATAAVSDGSTSHVIALQNANDVVRSSSFGELTLTRNSLFAAIGQQPSMSMGVGAVSAPPAVASASASATSSDSSNSTLSPADSSGLDAPPTPTQEPAAAAQSLPGKRPPPPPPQFLRSKTLPEKEIVGDATAAVSDGSTSHVIALQNADDVVQSHSFGELTLTRNSLFAAMGPQPSMSMGVDAVSAPPAAASVSAAAFELQKVDDVVQSHSFGELTLTRNSLFAAMGPQPSMLMNVGAVTAPPAAASASAASDGRAASSNAPSADSSGLDADAIDPRLIRPLSTLISHTHPEAAAVPAPIAAPAPAPASALISASASSLAEASPAAQPAPSLDNQPQVAARAPPVSRQLSNRAPPPPPRRLASVVSAAPAAADAGN